MNRIILISVAFMLVAAHAIAQTAIHDATITGPATDPDPSAVFDAKSTNKGMMVPRVSLTGPNDAATVPTPATSLLVYNTSSSGGLSPGYYYNSGNSGSPVWTRLMSGNTTPLTGNGAVNKVAFWTSGTDLSQDNLLHWNNTDKRLGVGVASPSVTLEVGGRITASDHISTTAGNLHTNRGRMAFSNTATDPNHSIYNNYVDIDGEGVWDGMKMNVFAGLDVRTGNAATSSQVSNLLVTNGFVRVGRSTGASTLEIGDINTAEWRLYTGGYGLSIGNDYDDNGTYDVRMYLRNDGNVGIGATAPAARLDVRGTKIELSNSTTELEGLSLQTQYVNDNSSSRVFFRENASSAYGFSWLFAGADNPNLDGTAFTLPQNYLYLLRHDNSATGSIAMGISRSNGNVGIGVGNALEKLHVDGGTARISGLSGGGVKPVYANNDGTLTTSLGTFTRVDPLYIRGTGLNSNGARVLKIGDTQVYNTASGRGLRLTVINKADHSVASDATYDTYGSAAASDNLATALNAISKTQMGVLTSYDAWENAVTTNLRNVFQRLGLYKALMTSTGSRRSYAAVFEASSSSGVPSASAVEVEHSDNANQPFAELRGYLMDGAYVVASQVPSGLSTPVGNFAAAVNESGNLGIGVTSPAQKLHVAGTGRFTSLASANRLVYATSNGDLAVSTSDINPNSLLDGAGTLNYIPKWTPDGNTLGNSLLFDNGTNVGLGTVSPTVKLHMVSNGSTYTSPEDNNVAGIMLRNTNNSSANAHSILALRTGGASGGNPFVSFDVAGVTGWSIGQDRADGNKLKFANAWSSVATNTRMTVQTDGNVGINTTAPATRLHVADGYPILAGNDGMLKVKSIANTGSGGCCGTETVLLQTSIDNRAEDYTISGYGGDVRHILALQQEGGRVAIGSVSAAYKLDVNGNTQIQGGLYTQGTASTLYGANASIYANNGNANGGGIMVSDDGGFVDYNDGPVTFVGSTGLRIAGNSGASSSNAYLRVNGLGGGGTRQVYADNNGTLTVNPPAGKVLNMVMENVTGSSVTVSSTTYTVVASFTYTRVSNNSYIMVEFNTDYDIGGHNSDSFFSRLVVGGTQVGEGWQKWSAENGGGTRSGTLFPVMGRYTNSATGTITITAEARRSSADDNGIFYRDLSTWFKVTEVSR